MPSTIVPIDSTRQYSVLPAKGLRYGNFEQAVYLPPMTCSSGRLTERNVSELNNQQIYKKVCEWYDTWKPWQQRMALCGISNRCSIRQLDVIATSLEPVKHRDYFTASKHCYPSASFKTNKIIHKIDILPSKTKKKKPTVKQKQLLKNEKKIKTPASRSQSSKSVQKYRIKGLDTGTKNIETVHMSEKKDSRIQVVTSIKTVDDFAEKLSLDIINSSLESIADKLSINQQSEKTETYSSTSKIDKKPSKEIDNQNSPSALCSIPNQLSLISSKTISPSTSSSVNLSISQSLGNRNSFSFDFLGKTLEFNPSSAKVKNRNNCSSKNVQKDNLMLSPVDTVDFFEKNNMQKLGPLQRELGGETVRLVTATDNLPVPLAKFYKHIKFWPLTPAAGKHFAKAKSTELIVNFQDQLCQIWMWMNDWEDFEKIAQLKEIMKISTPEILSVLLDHIHQKLEDEKDVNILNDRLLLYIFSYLLPIDICTVSQVCRRWRYLCTLDELWILKCLEMGEEEGIHNIPGLVLEANTTDMMIDWKLAYQELYQLVQIMKESLQDLQNNKQDDVKEEAMPIFENTADLPNKRRHSLMTELKLRRGTISRIRKQEEIPTTLKQLAGKDDASSDSDMSDEDLSPFMTEYTILPPIDEKSNSFDWCNSAKRLRRRTIVRTSLHNIAIDTEGTTTSTSLSGERSKTEMGENLKNKDGGDEDDKALDIRPRLVQAVDLLGKTQATMNLEWKKTEVKEEIEPGNILKNTVYAGSVKSVLRVRKLQGHMNGIMCLQYDKRRLVTAGLDRTIRIWDIRSGRSIHKLYGHKGGIRCLYFDNDILATGSWDCTILIWNMHQYSKETILIGHTDCVSCVQFNKSVIVSGSYDGTVRIWCRKIFTCTHVIQHGGSIRSLALDNDNIISSSDNMSVRMSDLNTGQCLKIFDDVQTSILSVKVQGSLIVGGDVNGVVYFWNKENGESEAAIQAHTEAVHSIAIHKGRFLTASVDGNIKEWDLMTMTCVRLLQGHKGPVQDVKVSDERIVSCSDDGTVRIWDLVLPKAKPQN